MWGLVMNYRIDVRSWGRVFTVPCSVVDKYLKVAEENYIKVLLCVLSLGSENISSEKLSEMTEISEREVIKALSFWNANKVISAESDDDFIGFTPDEEVTVQKSETRFVPDKSELDRANNNYYSPSQIAQIIESSDELRALFQEVQTVLGRILSNADQRGFIFIYEEYGFSPASVLLLTEYCKDIGKTSIAYIKSVARSWFEQDIISYESIEKHIIKLNEYHTYENKIKSVFGITIKLTSKQSAYIEEWKSKGISPELAELAYEMCADKTGKLIFKYINTILESWHSQGIKTKAQAEAQAYKPKNTGSTKEHSYDTVEIDDFQKNFLLNRKKVKDNV